MDERGTTAAWRGKSVRDHRDDRIEIAPNEFAIGPCPRDQFVEIVLGTGAARRLRRDLLSQDVERRVVRHDGVEVAAAGCPQQRRAFHEVVQRDREHSPFWGTADCVTRSADTLQQRRDAVRRSDLTDEIDVPDVDTELQ